MDTTEGHGPSIGEGHGPAIGEGHGTPIGIGKAFDQRYSKGSKTRTQKERLLEKEKREEAEKKERDEADKHIQSLIQRSLDKLSIIGGGSVQVSGKLSSSGVIITILEGNPERNISKWAEIEVHATGKPYKVYVETGLVGGSDGSGGLVQYPVGGIELTVADGDSVFVVGNVSYDEDTGQWPLDSVDNAAAGSLPSSSDTTIVFGLCTVAVDGSGLVSVPRNGGNVSLKRLGNGDNYDDASCLTRDTYPQP